jgi:hypothetical protein
MILNKSKKSIESIIRELENKIARNRAKKLGRGNLLLQRGKIVDSQEWAERKKNHPQLLAKISHRLHPEKYS